MGGAVHAFVGYLLLAWHMASAVSPQALEKWFASPDGLAMGPSDAQKLADNNWKTLTMCDVSVVALQLLRDAMAEELGMDMQDVRADILSLAELHVVPRNLTAVYVALSTDYELWGGLGFSAVEAAERAVPMAKAKIEVGVLYDLYKVMYGWLGLGFSQTKAQLLSIQQALAGADAATFKEKYKKAISSGASDEIATDVAVRESVNNYLAPLAPGLVRRYGKDAELHSSAEFQQQYGATQWIGEWLISPMELRVSPGLKEHSASWFHGQFGSQWQRHYIAAAEAIQQRISDDGKAHGINDFQKHHGDDWRTRWADAPEVPCTVCGPFVHRIALGTTEIVV